MLYHYAYFEHFELWPLLSYACLNAFVIVVGVSQSVKWKILLNNFLKKIIITFMKRYGQSEDIFELGYA